MTNNRHISIAHALSPAESLLKRMGATASIALLAAGCVPAEHTSDAATQTTASATEHAKRISDAVKCLVPSPQWYKNLWLDLNAPDNDLGRALMTHYMSCRGSTFHLSEAQFKTLPVALVTDATGPVFTKRSFIDSIAADGAKTEGEIIQTVDETVLASTHYGNTLGHFQLHLRGALIWQKNMVGALAPHFRGQARVSDNYDFNPSATQPKESWRGRDTELRVRIAHVGMPGRPFQIESDWIPYDFTIPKYESDLIQFSPNDDKSGYSDYGEKLQAILMTELRSERWQKSSSLEKLKIVVRLLTRLHQEVVKR